MKYNCENQLEYGSHIIEELDKVLSSLHYHLYRDDKDREIGEALRWKAYGAWDQGILYIEAKFNDKRWVVRHPQGILSPSMRSRMFGPDIADVHIINDLTEWLFENHIKKEITNEGN